MDILTFGSKAECSRCGQCCVKGSPTLHLGDSQLLKDGTLNYKDLFTIREGELVYNNMDDEFITIDCELIKIREKAGCRTCFFHSEDASSCDIYENRPVQCRAYECWDTEKFMTAFTEDKLTRAELLKGQPSLIEIVNAHDLKCSYKNLEGLFSEIAQGKDYTGEVLEILGYDTYLRPLLIEKTGVPEEYLGLLLGRPLIETVIMFGYKVEKDDEGNYCLLPIQ
ncbi:YkgJ family cysteine cluster protein [Candidatus Magnetominusculus dajiuhuensis]|uniref:YkgJ family cysteine cluster protein n=1 Tax=Candidatus Magnetominusculus dajiuhuensis TaxID=3137712 RepID=UPI003B432D0F